MRPSLPLRSTGQLGAGVTARSPHGGWLQVVGEGLTRPRDRGAERLLRWWLLSLSMAMACVEPARVPRDGGEEVPDCASQPAADACDAYSRDNVFFTWSQAMCSFLLGCCATADREALLVEALGGEALEALRLREPALMSEPLACRRAIATALFSRFGEAVSALDEGRREYDREAALACVSWYQRGASECVPGFMSLGAHEPAACAKMFGPAVSTGGACRSSGDCVTAPDGGASTCESASTTLTDGGFRWSLAGVCRALPGPGDACPLPWSECSRGHFCSLAGRCEPRVEVGAPCVAGLCVESAACELAMTPATCVLRKGSGEPCRSDRECRERTACHPALGVCLETAASFEPLDVEFGFCLGQGAHRVARRLPGVPSDGGL